jgi:hypothetical protein
MMLHPDPSENILLPIMDPNLSEIARTWIAAVILTGGLIIPPINSDVRPNVIHDSI